MNPAANAWFTLQDLERLTVDDAGHPEWVSATVTALPIGRRPWFSLTREFVAEGLATWRWCQCGREAEHFDFAVRGLDYDVDGVLCCGGAACCVDRVLPIRLFEETREDD